MSSPQQQLLLEPFRRLARDLSKRSDSDTSLRPNSAPCLQGNFIHSEPSSRNVSPVRVRRRLRSGWPHSWYQRRNIVFCGGIDRRTYTWSWPQSKIWSSKEAELLGTDREHGLGFFCLGCSEWLLGCIHYIQRIRLSLQILIFHFNAKFSACY